MDLIVVVRVWYVAFPNAPPRLLNLASSGWLADNVRRGMDTNTPGHGS